MVKPKGTDTENTEKSVKPKSDEPGLPLTRIKTIMKSTADTGLINHEGLFVMAKATEHFIQYLAKKAFNEQQSRMLKYEQLSTLVDEQDNLEFLQQIIPKKITIGAYKKIIADKTEDSNKSSSDSENNEDEDDDDDDDDEDDDDEDEDEEVQNS